MEPKESRQVNDVRMSLSAQLGWAVASVAVGLALTVFALLG
jgi:hypothetical protein